MVGAVEPESRPVVEGDEQATFPIDCQPVVEYAVFAEGRYGETSHVLPGTVLRLPLVAEVSVIAARMVHGVISPCPEYEVEGVVLTAYQPDVS